MKDQSKGIYYLHRCTLGNLDLYTAFCGVNIRWIYFDPLNEVIHANIRDCKVSCSHEKEVPVLKRPQLLCSASSVNTMNNSTEETNANSVFQNMA